jgi:hypothetical protein
MGETRKSEDMKGIKSKEFIEKMLSKKKKEDNPCPK